MKNLRAISLLILSVGLSACATHNAGVTPVSPAPVVVQQLSGHIDQNTYSNTIGTQAKAAQFSVMIPQAAELKDTTLIDEKGSNYSQVTLGPGLSDKNIYRAQVNIIPSTPPFYTQAQQQFNDIVTHFNTPSNPAIRLYVQRMIYDGHSAIMGVYQQRIQTPGRFVWDKPNQEELTQIVYVIKYYGYMESFWITANSLSQVNAVNGANRLSVIQQTWQPGQAFIKSLKISK